MGNHKNPLLIPELLENVFEVADFTVEDFRNYRLVCKDWHYEASRRWRKEAWLNVVPDNVETHLTNGGIQMKQYLALLNLGNDSFYDLTGRPFRRYRISAAHIRLRGKVNAPKLEFWTKVGKLMQSLSLEDCHFQYVHDFRRILFELTPNLKHLLLSTNIYRFKQSDLSVRSKDVMSIGISQNNLIDFNIQYLYDINSPHPQFPITWTELFLHFPKIQALFLSAHERDGVRAFGMEELEDVLTSLEFIRDHRPERFPVLQKLDTKYLEFGVHRSFPNPTLIELLERLQLPLTDLGFGMDYQPDEPSIARVLEIHSTTLERLNIGRPRFFPPLSMNLITFQFPMLTALMVTRRVFPDLLFVKQMPNLKVLVFQDNEGYHPCPACLTEAERIHLTEIYGNVRHMPTHNVVGRTNFSELQGLVLTSMESFTAQGVLCSAEQMEELSRLMPNLTTLQLGLTDEGFEVVAQKWPSLQKIHIKPFRLTEQGLLGTVRRTMYRKPNITNLRYLQYFGMEISKDDLNFDWGLTNEALLHGLFRLDHLTDVSAFLSLQVNQDVKDQFLERFCVWVVSSGVHD